MKTYLLFISFIFLAALNSINAQVFPYLNASTGNEDQYIVDADTNVIMFHDNQIEKLDKNFNPIWVKRYDGLSFHSLLQSKTGSIYFIASDTVDYRYAYSLNTNNIGKIDNNGNLVWCKTNIADSIRFYKLLLDRNNDLMTSCNRGLIKFDTIGNMLLYKKIQTTLGVIANTNKLTILEDSSGYYSCAYAYSAFEATGIGFFKYSEPLDSFIVETAFNEYPQFWVIDFAGFYKSIYEPGVYYSISIHRDATRYFSVRKHNKENILWNKQFYYGSPTPYNITSFDEDISKNILFNLSPSNTNGFHATYNNSNIKIDSNGVGNGFCTNFLNYSWWPPNALYESANLKYFFGKNYFYTNVGENFSKNPLTITVIDSSITSYCSSNSVLTLSTNITAPVDFSHYLIKQNITPYSLTTRVVTTNNILNFGTINNYCSVLGIKEATRLNQKISIYPNPSNTILNILASDKVEEVSVFDVTGKKVFGNTNNYTIDVSLLTNGIYFIKIITDKGEFKQKFIKE